jgi:hypothetical protein
LAICDLMSSEAAAQKAIAEAGNRLPDALDLADVGSDAQDHHAYSRIQDY